MKYYTGKLIADDWGISPGVNEGIEALVSLGVVKVVSVLVDGEYVSHGLRNLIEKYPDIKFSLHFNLTFNKSSDSIWKLIVAYITNNLTAKNISIEFTRQLDVCQQLGVKISMIDGHHHVHLLPFVFNAIKNEMHEREIDEYRIMYDKSHLPTFLLSNIHLYLGSENKTKKVLVGYLRHGDLKNKLKFKKKLDKFTGVICHPSIFNDFDQLNIKDSLSAGRVVELNRILELINE